MATGSSTSCCSAPVRAATLAQGPTTTLRCFLNGPDSFNAEAARLAPIETDILFDTGAVINAMPFHAGA
jgi:hypothetical protein